MRTSTQVHESIVKTRCVPYPYLVVVNGTDRQHDRHYGNDLPVSRGRGMSELNRTPQREAKECFVD
jgi:hypothetical protein